MSQSTPTDSDHTKTQIKHLVFLDGLRALAALYVLVHHAYSISTEYRFFDGVQPLVRQAAAIFTAGHLAVDLFIVLSGFSLMLAVLRKEQVQALWPFLRRRAQRILPPYYAALALPILIHFATGNYLLTSSELTVWPIVAHLLLIHDMFADTWGQINNVLWSVSVEWRIYLLFPFFSYLYLKYGTRAVLLAATAGFIGAVAFCQAFHLTQLYNWTGICPQYLILFALGMTCAAFRFSTNSKYIAIRETLERVPRRSFWVMLLPFGLLLLKGGTLWRVFGPSAIFVYDIIVGCFAALLLWYASYTRGRETSRNVFSSTGLARIGLMAYSIYLVHYPVLLLTANLVRDYISSNTIRLLLMYTVGIALAYGCAILFYRFIEQPFAIPKKKPQSTTQTK